MSFQNNAESGDVLGAIRTAIVYGSLWAIGSSWSIAIREVVRAIFPENSIDRILAELASAGITTIMGVSLSVLATRTWCYPRQATPGRGAAVVHPKPSRASRL